MNKNPKNIKDILNRAIIEVKNAYQVELNIENILYYAQDIINALKGSQYMKDSFWKKLLELQNTVEFFVS